MHVHTQEVLSTRVVLFVLHSLELKALCLQGEFLCSYNVKIFHVLNFLCIPLIFFRCLIGDEVWDALFLLLCLFGKFSSCTPNMFSLIWL